MDSLTSLLRKRAPHFLIISCVVLVTGVAVGNTWRRSWLGTAQSNFGTVNAQKGELLRKRRDIPTDDQAQLTINVNGVLPTDYVNIRPTPKRQIEVVAGTVINGNISDTRPGGPLPDAALDISDTSVTFNRPAADGSIFLDIQVPVRLKVQIAFDGVTMVAAALREPVSFRGKQIGIGSTSAAETVAQATLPQGINREPGTARSLGNGKFFVPFAQLRVMKRVALDKGTLVAAVLEIDSNGRVINVKSLMGAMPAEMEDNLKKWEFMPYQSEGRAVPVVTVLTPKNQ